MRIFMDANFHNCKFALGVQFFTLAILHFDVQILTLANLHPCVWICTLCKFARREWKFSRQDANLHRTSYFLLEVSRAHPGYFLLPTSYFLLPTSYFPLPTSYFLLPTSYFLLPTSYSLLPTPYFLLPTSYFLLPTSYCKLRGVESPSCLL